jgi:adenylate cyclase
MTHDLVPTPGAIRKQLKKIVTSPVFRGSDKQKKFLDFVVEESLKKPDAHLKAYNVAVAVYNRDDHFDPQVDPIVRVEAGRLRRALEHYYLTAGVADGVVIDIPKGSYKPAFKLSTVSALAEDSRPVNVETDLLPLNLSIAVLPIANLSSESEQDYFTDGLTEELTSELSRYQDFRVVAAQSTLKFKSAELSYEQVGQDLGVRYLLEGSVRKDNKAIKVTIRLLDTYTAEQVWSEGYKRDLTATDLIGIQEEIAQSVTGMLADQFGLITRVLSKESRRTSPVRLRTYDAVLSFYYFETNLTPVSFEAAFKALQKATKREPEYGLSWSMLGHLYADNHALGFCEDDNSLKKALSCAQKGLALAPENQFVWDALSLVYFHLGEKDLFLQHVEQTISLNPNAPYIIGVAGWHMMFYGEWQKGMDLLRKGMQFNPFYPTWFHLAVYAYYYHRGDYLSAYMEALKFNFPQLFWDQVMRASSLGQLGRKDEATAAAGELLQVCPDFLLSGRQLIRNYVKVEGLVDSVVEGLNKAGLTGVK